MKHSGDLIIRSSGDEALDKKVTSVGGDLFLHPEAKLEAPALTSVGGALYLHPKAKLEAPALTSVGYHLALHPEAKLEAPALYPPGFANFRVIDRLAAVVLSTKRRGDIDILLCRQARIQNQKLIGDKFYVASRNGVNAHGKTAALAVAELRFKTQTRDVTPYRNLPLTKRMSTSKWVDAYRIVTGACQLGTHMFLSQAPHKKSYTLAEVLDLTKDQYGAEEFRKVTCND